jgi:NADPH2:quinone reductase
VLGFLGGGPSTPRTNYLMIKGLEVIGVMLGGVTQRYPEVGRANMKLLVELAGQGKLKPRISHRFPLEQAADAVQVVIDRKVIGKAVLLG